MDTATEGQWMVDIYAAQTEPGLILWWKHNRRQYQQVPYPILLPSGMVWNERNTRPGWQPQPAPAFAIGLRQSRFWECANQHKCAPHIGSCISYRISNVPPALRTPYVNQRVAQRRQHLRRLSRVHLAPHPLPSSRHAHNACDSRLSSARATTSPTPPPPPRPCSNW